MDNSSWIDILPPAAPDTDISAWLWLLFIFLSLTLVAFYLWHTSARRKSLRILNALQHQLDNKQNLKNIAFTICDILKLYYNVNNIQHITLADHPDWLNYKQDLAQACFKYSTPQQESIEKLLSETRYWITQRVK